MIGRCATCRRQLDLEGDPLSLNTGGDCWGCVGHMEALCGGDRQQHSSIGFIAKEIEWSLSHEAMSDREADRTDLT
jgi:hypothetical protein